MLAMRTKPWGGARVLLEGGRLTFILMLTVLQLNVAAAEEEFSLAIPFLPVASALKSLSFQTGHSVLFQTDDVEAIHTNAIEGRYTLRDALDALLNGTSLTGGLTESGVITISLLKEQRPNREIGMLKGNFRKSLFAGLATIFLGGAATAQQSSASTDAASEPVEEVVVVGTQIRGANIADSLPVTLLDETDIDALGSSSGEEIFRFLPSQGAMAFSGDKDAGGLNSARGDVASINLRSLGTGNALVLLNGRRMVLHPGTQAEGGAPVVTPNLNSLPTAGISRIEVLRDGASAIYGADAVAGVINTVLKDDFEGFELTTRYGDYAGVDAGALSVNGYGGFKFNQGRTTLTLFGSFYDRGGISSLDRRYSANEDKRPLVVGTEFEGDSQLNNTSTSGPWGQFLAAQPVRQNGELVTSSAGIFHVQPATMSGCRASLASDLCMDDGSLDTALRYNRANTTQPAADLKRYNAFAFARHELENGRELYGELSYYLANSTKPRDGSPLQAAVPITIAASAYYNPFGAVLLPDGSPNPNRLANIDAPAEGLDLVIGGPSGRYAIIDGGPRFANVENTSWRSLAGIRGDAWGGWEFDSAILYSIAETNDVSPGSVSNTLFQQALNRTTPDAYNPFNGGNINELSGLDTTLNPQSALDTFLVTARRDSKTSLLLGDFKLSNASLFALSTGDVGAAFGIEGRRESYEDDRDDRLDGVQQFTDSITGEVFDTDVLGQSGTLDTKGDRNTFSAFMEVYLPLLSREQGVPLAQSMDLQLAARYEHASDFGGVLVPKAALSWRLIDSLQIRSSYSEGFRAPNLEVVNAESLVRGNDSTDWYRCQAQVNLGTIPSLSACSQVQRVFSTRSGNRDLEPESSRTYSVGAVFQLEELIPNLTLTVDFYDIEQEDVVGIAGDDVQVALDFVRRLDGASNPAIIRADPTADDVTFFAGSGLAPAGAIISLLDPYFNIESRSSRGVEFGVYYDLRDARLGDFGFNIDASHLLEFEQGATANALEIGTEPLADSIVLPGSGSRVEREGFPKWRGLARATWSKGDLGAGLSVSYIGSFFDTSTTQDDTGALFPVDEWITANVYFQYTLRNSWFGEKDIRVRVGANNVTNEAPPLADEEHGYYTDYHDNRGRLLYGEVRVAF